MEHDLIRRSKLLAKKCMIRGHLDTGSPCPSKVKAVPVDVIEREPAVDAVPVRHGRWVEKEKYTFGIMYDCSLCENRIIDNGHPWNYCPNCGARMDGGDKNDE